MRECVILIYLLESEEKDTVNFLLDLTVDFQLRIDFISCPDYVKGEW